MSAFTNLLGPVTNAVNNATSMFTKVIPGNGKNKVVTAATNSTTGESAVSVNIVPATTGGRRKNRRNTRKDRRTNRRNTRKDRRTNRRNTRKNRRTNRRTNY